MSNSIQEQILNIQRGMAELEREVSELSSLYERLEVTQVTQREDIDNMKVEMQSIAQKTDMNQVMMVNNTTSIERVADTLQQVQQSVQNSVVENTNAMRGVTDALVALTDKIHTEKVERIEKDHLQDLELQESVAELKEIIVNKTDGIVVDMSQGNNGEGLVDIAKTIVTAPWFSAAVISALAASGIAIQTLK